MSATNHQQHLRHCTGELVTFLNPQHLGEEPQTLLFIRDLKQTLGCPIALHLNLAASFRRMGGNHRSGNSTMLANQPKRVAPPCPHPYFKMRDDHALKNNDNNNTLMHPLEVAM